MLINMDFLLNNKDNLEATIAGCTYYNSWYYLYAIDLTDLTYQCFDETYSGVGTVHTYKGLTVQRTTTHQYTFTATDGYHLYGTWNTTSPYKIIDYGVNGSATISSYYSGHPTMVAVKGDLTEIS